MNTGEGGMHYSNGPSGERLLIAFLLLTSLQLAGCGQVSETAALQPIPIQKRQSPFTTGVNAVLYDQDDVNSIASLGDKGTMSARVTCYWSDIEPTEGNWHFEIYDDLVGRAQSNNVPLLGILAYSMKRVSIATSGVPGNPWALSYYPPDDMTQFAVYAGKMAARYPEIQYWEVWNEPNSAHFWNPHPDPARYTEMLRLSYAAIKSANPQATVILGGLSPGIGKGQVNTQNSVDFLTTVYESGGNNFFDAVAFHPYNDGVEPSLYLEKYVTNLHDVMLKYGDSDKKIWVTEFGSYSGTSPDAVSEPLQAEYLTRAFTILHNMEFVDCAYWYNLKDYTTTPNPANPAINYGLFRYDGSRRPAADSLKDFLQSTPN